MKKSSLKKYITLLEAAADSAKYASAYWVRQHELREEELLEAKNHIAELERRLDDNGGLERRLDDNGGLCTLRAKLTAETCQETIKRLREGNELKDEELLKAKDEITELKRRLDDNGGPCALRVKLTAETCGQTIKRLWKDKERLREDNERLREDNERLREDNERLLEASPTHQHNHTFERDNNDTQA